MAKLLIHPKSGSTIKKAKKSTNYLLLGSLCLNLVLLTTIIVLLALR